MNQILIVQITILVSKFLTRFLFPLKIFYSSQIHPFHIKFGLKKCDNPNSSPNCIILSFKVDDTLKCYFLKKWIPFNRKKMNTNIQHIIPLKKENIPRGFTSFSNTIWYQHNLLEKCDIPHRVWEKVLDAI